jgi:outer membrane protein
MRRKCLVVVALSFLSAGGRAFAADYTLDQLIDTALARSKQLASVKREIEKTEEQIREAYGSAMPKISASVNVSHAFAQYIPYDFGGGYDSATFVNNMMGSYDQASQDPRLSDDERSLLLKLGPTITGVTINQLTGMLDMNLPKNTTAFSLSLNQPIFAQGKVRVGLKIATAYMSTLRRKYDGEKRKIIGAVTGVYLGALMARKNVEIQQESVTLAQETHRLTVIRHAIGKATEFDTLSSRLRLENALIELDKAQSDCSMAYETLIVQCGLSEPASTFAVSGDLPVPPFDLTLDESLAKMHESNDQIAQLTGGEAVQNELVNFARTDYFPLVYAGGSLSRIGQFDDLNSSRWGNDQKVFVGLSWEIFSGFTRRHKLRQKAADRDIFLLSKKQAIDGLELATRNAFEKVRVNRKRYLAMSSVITLAEKGYTIAKKSFEIGSGTQIDMQNAELELNKSRLACNALLLSYNTALIELKLLLGSL